MPAPRAGVPRAKVRPSPLPVIPRPRRATPGEGAFRLEEGTWISHPPEVGVELGAAVGRWAEGVRRASGLPLPVGPGRSAGEPGGIRLTLDPGASEWPEGYALSVRPEGVLLSAPSPAGLFYGLQTLRQLLPPEVEGAGGPEVAGAASRAPGGGSARRPPARPLRIAAAEIEDAPRFSWRGMHLDVGRHFFPVSFLERYLDLMALHKLNRFHWHLTDDQGWRLEVKRYPRLTEVGAFRKETVVGKRFDPYVGDRTPHGGYYTQEEVRKVVAYARERFITVIPEIEMPGHALAALAAYPELACTPGPFELATRWGVFEDVFCPGEETFRFLEGVLEEVTELFPGPYVHVGGDEVATVRWKESATAREVMRREGLREAREIHGYFLRRVGDVLRSRGRRLIGWDEVLEAELPPDAVVMSWRGMEGGAEAARRGYEVVMTPASHVYFDHYQGDPEREPLAIGGYTPLEKVYGFEPVPEGLEAEAATRILGAQGNVWTEYMKTPEHVEYMVFPRLLALSEVVWSPAGTRDREDFLRRLGPGLERLDALDVNYRRPDLAGVDEGRTPGSGPGREG